MENVRPSVCKVKLSGSWVMHQDNRQFYKEEWCKIHPETVAQGFTYFFCHAHV